MESLNFLKENMVCPKAVSYTHLDVYKRQLAYWDKKTTPDYIEIYSDGEDEEDAF